MTRRSEIGAKTGWELFANADGSVTQEQLTEELERRGLPAVSDRMYDHYGRLRRFGIDSYMPINEFDIARKKGWLSEAS